MSQVLTLRKTSILLTFLFVGLLPVFFASIAAAQNRFEVSVDAVRVGLFEPADTLYANGDYVFRVCVRNDDPISGFVFPFRLYTPDNIGWTWTVSPMVSVIILPLRPLRAVVSIRPKMC